MIVSRLTIASSLLAVLLCTGCLTLFTGIHVPSEVYVDAEFGVAIDGAIVGHGGGMAAVIVQYPEEFELVGARYISEHIGRQLRRNASIVRHYKAEGGHRVVALADSIPQSRETELSPRVLLRFKPKETGLFTLKFATGTFGGTGARVGWRVCDPADVTDFADIVDERYVRTVRVIVAERNGTAALQLAGKRDYLLFPDSGVFRLPLMRDYSVEMWCKTTSISVPLLSSRRDDYHSEYPFELFVNAWGEAALRCADGRRTYGIGRGQFIADGRWHHLAASYCSDSMRFSLFVDGSPAGSVHVPQHMRRVDADELLLGTTRARAVFAAAEFEELRFWENCRNEQEIEYYKDLALSGFESQLSVLFSFDGGRDGIIPGQTSQLDSVVALAYNRPRLVVSTTPLRIELLAFSAVLDGGSVLMTWETFDESKVLRYEVEKRTESGRYMVYESVEPQRLPERHQQYALSDVWSGRAIHYYRLRKVNTDGSIVFSAEIPIGLESILNFSLEDNAPNPFTDSTVIRYSLSKRTRVDLVVFDIMGREVAVLVSERQEPGSYAATFRASEFAGGMYFYKMRTSAGSQTKKMYLAR